MKYKLQQKSIQNNIDVIFGVFACYSKRRICWFKSFIYQMMSPRRGWIFKEFLWISILAYETKNVTVMGHPKRVVIVWEKIFLFFLLVFDRECCLTPDFYL